MFFGFKKKKIDYFEKFTPKFFPPKAKDFVEKLPGTLKKEVKKEEAEVIQKKLAEVGCTVTII